MANLTDSEVLQVLEAAARDGVGKWHSYGYEWLRDTFLPCLQYAQDHLSDQAFLISTCYYVLGDFHDFNHAPKAAIKAYERSLDWYPEAAETYRELASMYENMGDYMEAAEMIAKAIDLDPGDDHLKSEQKYILKSLANNDAPLYAPDDPVWRCDELLAIEEPHQALAVLEGLEEVEHLQARARCFGMLEDIETYLDQWKEIARRDSRLEIHASDWFFMPEEIYDDPRIWRILLRLLGRLNPGVHNSYDCFHESEAMRKLGLFNTYRLDFEFNLYRTERNTEQLAQLLETYPEWTEVREELEELQKQGRQGRA